MVYVPVKEEFHWKLRKKGKHLFNICRHVLVYSGVTAGLMASVSSVALANPTGGTVVGGSATIVDTASELQIHQSSDRTLIEWASFDIDAGETTRFLQPDINSIALNRVVNSAQLSTLNGNLIANGRVVVINPNGVLIGADGNIDTAGFIATSANVDDDAFVNGTGVINFNSAGNIDAVVENSGNITVGEAGLAALVAPTVRNSGVVQGNLAKIQLAAADTFAVDFYGDGLISFAVDAPAEGSSRIIESSNSGFIIADGGQVLMTAAAATNVVESVINSDGYIQAASLQNIDGKIVLTGAGADIIVSGTLDVSGQDNADGGTINIGGDYQGQGELAKADTVEITETAKLYSDADNNGDGGDIIVWSEEETISRGEYYARGGDESGNGGLVETSSKGDLDVNGTYVNTLAENGDAGYWLLDPDNIIVGDTGDDYDPSIHGDASTTGTANISVATLNSADTGIVLAASNDITFSGELNIIESGVGVQALAGRNLTVNAGGTLRTNDGDIFLTAGNDLTINNSSTLFTRGGDIGLTASLGTLTINSSSLGTWGGYVNLVGKTSVSITSTDINTTGGIYPGFIVMNGDNTLYTGTLMDKGDYETTVETTENGGTITITSDNLNNVDQPQNCFSAGGSSCVVEDPIFVTDLVVTIWDWDKIYGVLDPSYLSEGFLDNDDTYWAITDGTLDSGDTLSVDLYRTGDENVGIYDIMQSEYALSDPGSYSVVFVNGAFGITPADLTITADSFNKVYGTEYTFLGTEFDTSGLVNEIDGVLTNDSIDLVVLSSDGSDATANVGDYVITVSNAIGSGLSNYNVSYLDGALTVNRAALNVTANNDGKVYDAVAYGGGNGVTYSGFVNGETSTVLGGTLGYSGTSQGATNVGTYGISANGLTSGNYTITYNDGSLIITPTALTITADNQTKTYGDTFVFTGNEFGTSGLVGGETLTSVVLGSTGAVNTADVASSPYAITITNATGGTADLSNYSVSYANGQMTVNPAALNVTANNDGKVYDAVAYSGGNGVTYSGFVNSETSTVLDGTLGYSGTSQGATNVGNYVISVGGLTSGNYAISYTDGQLMVSPAELLVAANDQSKTYGDADPTLTFATFGLQGVDTAGSVLSGALVRDPGENVGGYDIEQGTLGLATGNYVLGFENGTLSITPATLTVLADFKTKVKGTVDPALTYQVRGLKLSDTEGSVLYGDLNRNPGENVGDYDILRGRLGLLSRNYKLAYNPNILAITGAPVVVPDPVVAVSLLPEIDPLGRPIISVANQAIVLDESFEEIEILELETNVGISSAGIGATMPSALAGITPAAGGEEVSETQLASLEPSAGGNDEDDEDDDEFAYDRACANSFLDNKPCKPDE